MSRLAAPPLPSWLERDWTGLDLRWPWVLPVVAVAALLLMAFWARRRRARLPADPLLVAHVARLRALPRFRTLVRRRRAVGALVTVASLVLLAGSAVLVARPQTVEVEQSEGRSRDIMLCLDASSSMDDDNVAVVQAMRRVVAGLSDDRIGLTLWSGAAVTVFPLTDDYAYVRDQLDLAERAFTGLQEDYFAGVQLPDPRSSLIGDGIVSCSQRFDRPDEERSRAVVVSSDNDPFGGPVYTLPEAAEYAADRDVLLYGIGAPVLADPEQDEPRTEFRQAMRTTGGVFALVGKDGATDQIVDRIDDLERQRVEEPAREVERDDPTSGVVLAGTGLGLLALAWLGQGLVRGVDAASRWRRRSAGRGSRAVR